MGNANQNLVSIWTDVVKRFGDKECFRYQSDGEWRSLHFHETDELVRNFALGLLALGFKPGARLALLSENRPEWAVTDLATLSVGGILVAVYSTNTSAQIGYVLQDCGAEIIVLSNHYQLKKTLASRETSKHLKHIIILDPIRDLTDSDNRVKSFADVVNLGKSHRNPDDLAKQTAKIGPNDVATFIYTSGTTGLSKGVILTHANLISNIEAAQQRFGIQSSDVSLSILPLSHSLERTAGHFAVLLSGAAVAYTEGIENLNQDLLDAKPTVLLAVPRVYEKIHATVIRSFKELGKTPDKIFEWAADIGRQSASFKMAGKGTPAYLELQNRLADRLVFQRIREGLGGNLRYMISGGAPLTKELVEFFFAINIPLYEGYGLTETSPIISVNYPGFVRPGTVGKPVPGVEVRIADDGEILVRGPNVMRGYNNLPEETSLVLVDGWFHTGDVGHFDADGFLAITDRKKDIIVTSGGKNIAPQMIENYLHQESYISQVCVLGDRRPFLTAVIVPDFKEISSYLKTQGRLIAGHKDMIKDQEVVELIRKSVDKVNTQLAKFETVNKFILSDIEFSPENGLLTALQKIKRKAIYKHFSQEVDQLY